MEIGNIQNDQYTQVQNQETIYMSKGLYEEAKNANDDPNKTAVIFNNKVVLVDNEKLESLKNEFPNDFKKYEDILIASKDAEKYLNKNSNNLLTPSNEDNNAITSKVKSLNTNNIISKQRDELEAEFKGTRNKNNSNFNSANELLNLKISLNKDKNLDITNDKIQDSNTSKDKTQEADISNDKTDEASNKDKGNLEELYKRQSKLQKQVSQVTMQMSKADEEETENLQNKLSSLNAEIAVIQEQIMAQIKEGKK